MNKFTKLILKRFLAKISYFVTKDFDHSWLKNKRIFFIGPAGSPYDYLNSFELLPDDIIIRVNKSPSLSIENSISQFDTRTDIWFHSLSEVELGGGGPLTSDIIKQQKVRFVIYPLHEKDIDYRLFLKRLLCPFLPIYRASIIPYKRVKKLYRAKWPTIGLMSLVYLMSLDFKELHVTGVTFFRTPYRDGYPTISNNLDQIIKYNNEEGFHDILAEAAIFKAFYEEELHNNKSIVLDDQLLSIMKTL